MNAGMSSEEIDDERATLLSGRQAVSKRVCAGLLDVCCEWREFYESPKGHNSPKR
jgi:hypothetical protein